MPKNKYGNIRTRIDGITFASKREARRYMALKLLERAGEITSLRCQQPFKIEIGNVKVCKYIADFCYYLKAGGYVVEDVKGHRTPLYKLKAKLMLACHGIRVKET